LNVSIGCHYRPKYMDKDMNKNENCFNK